MRVVIYTAAALIVLAVAWTLYLTHGLKDFESGLSEVPVSTTEPQRDTTAVESQTKVKTEGDDFLEDLARVPTDTQAGREITDSAPTPDSETSRHLETDINEEIEVSEEMVAIDESLKAETPTTDTVGACGEICEPSSVDFHSLSATERFQFWREGLTKRFGDISEVHLFIEQMELTHRNQTIPEHEILKYVRATATLFPNEANKRHLQEMELRVASRQTTER